MDIVKLAAIAVSDFPREVIEEALQVWEIDSKEYWNAWDRENEREVEISGPDVARVFSGYPYKYDRPIYLPEFMNDLDIEAAENFIARQVRGRSSVRIWLRDGRLVMDTQNGDNLLLPSDADEIYFVDELKVRKAPGEKWEPLKAEFVKVRPVWILVAIEDRLGRRVDVKPGMSASAVSAAQAISTGTKSGKGGKPKPPPDWLMRILEALQAAQENDPGVVLYTDHGLPIFGGQWTSVGGRNVRTRNFWLIGHDNKGDAYIVLSPQKGGALFILRREAHRDVDLGDGYIIREGMPAVEYLDVIDKWLRHMQQRASREAQAGAGLDLSKYRTKTGEAALRAVRNILEKADLGTWSRRDWHHLGIEKMFTSDFRYDTLKSLL